MRTLYRDAALADATGPELRRGVGILVSDEHVEWLGDVEDEPQLTDDTSVVDASGSTVIAGMVDSHSHLTLPGGAHWIDRGSDPPERLVEVAEHNARLLRSAGVRWARDVGSPMGTD
ncbi:MAG: hypothetical protein ACRDV4_07130, partial [Acidimicrobiales bacterium]